MSTAILLSLALSPLGTPTGVTQRVCGSLGVRLAPDSPSCDSLVPCPSCSGHPRLYLEGTVSALPSVSLGGLASLAGAPGRGDHTAPGPLEQTDPTATSSRDSSGLSRERNAPDSSS